MANEKEIIPESPRHDEQPLEHIKILHPETPPNPGKPTIDDDGNAVPAPGDPIS